MADQKAVTVASLLDAGKAIMSGEWRGYAPETIKYTSKKDGKAASFGRIVHTVEVGDGNRVEAVKVSQAVPDGTDPESVAVTFKKGQRVLVAVDSMEVEKGTRSVRAGGIYNA